MKKYDLIVIGSGTAGEKAALHAALHGYSVAVVEKSFNLGGAGVNTGTLPSKTLRETALFLSKDQDRNVFGINRVLEHQPTAKDLLFRERYVVNSESEEYRMQLLEQQVDVIRGNGSLVDAHHIAVTGEAPQTLEADFILLATGSSPFHPEGIPFDGARIHDSDSILSITRIPKSLCIVGAGVVGCEYATIFAELGTEVTLVHGHEDILPFLDREVAKALESEFERLKIKLCRNTRIKNIASDGEQQDALVSGTCEDGSLIASEMFLYTTGRQGNTRSLDIEKVGLSTDHRGNIQVDDRLRTTVESIYAAGDIIGSPALGSTSMEQGRLSVIHMFGLTNEDHNMPEHLPYGIYTIPEISMVGLTEEAARENGFQVVTSTAQYAENQRGLIMGAKSGWLKLVCDAESHRILGVHIIGIAATELIHFGMELVKNEKTIRQILGCVFNFPTLHELYRNAAYKLNMRNQTMR